ncbi:hypothetical protein [Candidatus Harpocratesius sp.]
MNSQKSIQFDYGVFNYKRKIYKFSNNESSSEIPIIEGSFYLSNKPSFYRDFKQCFRFYDLKSIESFPWTNSSQSYRKLISLGPYYPWNCFNIDRLYYGNITFPILSDIIFSSKSGPLDELKNKNLTQSKQSFIRNGRLEQLRILTNFFYYYLSKYYSIEADFIVPVPSKPKYSFNSVEEISKEFAKKSKIIHLPDIVQRTSNDEKSYCLNPLNLNLENKKIILIDENIREGETKRIISQLLSEKEVQSIQVFTLGRTDHSIYGYYD